MHDTIQIAPSLALLSPSTRRGLFARDREMWWTQEADKFALEGNTVWEARCRNEAAFWAEDAPPLAELLEGIDGRCQS